MIRNSILLTSMNYANPNQKPRRRIKKLYAIIRTEWTPERKAEFDAKVKLAKRKAGIK